METTITAAADTVIKDVILKPMTMVNAEDLIIIIN